MSIKNLLLWEKYRPKKIEDLILPQRIINHFEEGVTRNYIFHGHYGTGKTSLARILIGKYSKDKAFLEINSSLYTSIDTLRSDVENFCKTQPMIETQDTYKYVFLDEFERVSQQYQDALKAFIEQYHKNVRFILTTNHLSKISEGIKSRFTCLNFDAQDLNEEKFLKGSLLKKLISEVLPTENFEIQKEVLINLINKKFPDLRSIFVELQNLKESKNYQITDSNVSTKLKLELYDLIYNKSHDYEAVYHFLMTNFGPEKIDNLFKILGQDFITWSLENKKSVDKLFEANFIISELHFKLETNTDPIILGMTLIGKFRELLIEN
jgi:DNA polymerase III delta prime subunit